MSKVVKSNIRSFRYSDEVAEILEGMEGTSLNDKFENLVRTCYLRLPEIQERIEYYSDCVDKLQHTYMELSFMKKDILKKVGSIDSLLDDVVRYKNEINNLCNTKFPRDES